MRECLTIFCSVISKICYKSNRLKERADTDITVRSIRFPPTKLAILELILVNTIK